MQRFKVPVWELKSSGSPTLSEHEVVLVLVGCLVCAVKVSDVDIKVLVACANEVAVFLVLSLRLRSGSGSR